MIPGIRYDKNPFFSLFLVVARSHKKLRSQRTGRKNYILHTFLFIETDDIQYLTRKVRDLHQLNKDEQKYDPCPNDLGKYCEK